MSPHSADSSRTISPQRVGTFQLVLDNNDQSPPDEVDFVSDPRQAAQEERVKNASAKLQGVLPTNNAVPTNNEPSFRLRRHPRGGDDLFKFPPAPRHAPGHFTNRKIVPRTDGPETYQQANPQLPCNNVSKEDDSGPKSRSPPRDTAYDRPATFSSFALPALPAVHMEEGHLKQPAPPKRIGLPFAKNQSPPAFKGEGQTSMGITLRSAQDAIQAAQPRRSSNSPPQPAQPHILDKDHAASKDAEAASPTITRPQIVVNEAASPVSRPGDARTDPPQSLEVTMDGYGVEQLGVDASVGTRHPLMGPPQKPTMVLPPRVNGDSNPKQWLSDHRDHQVTGPRPDKQYPQMNRPMRHVRHGRGNTRSPSISSSSSGVSKGKARSSILDLNLFRDRELPEVANKMNNFYKLCNNAVKEAEMKVDKYRKKLHRTSQKLTNCLETLSVQGQSIQEFEDEKQDMHDCIDNLEQQLQAYSGKFPELADKCRTMKDTLNSAVKEKQELFELHSQYKKDSEAAIQEIRAEKQREQSLRELIDRQLTALREQMKERVRQVELQSQEECRRMNEKVQLLSQQVEEKESQAKRERDITGQLTKQLGESRKTQSSFEDMRAQTSKIVKMLSERQDGDSIDLVMLAQEDSKAKLEKMAEHMECLRGLFVPQCEAVTTLGSKQDEGISKIVSTLQTLYEAQSGSKETVEQLGKDVRGNIDEMWQHLETREDDLTQRLEDKRGENATLQGVIERGEQERLSLERQLRDANDLGKAQEDRIQDLVRKVDRLETQPRQDPEAKLRSEALVRENDDLKAQLETKCTSISDLEAKLNAKSASYKAEVDSLTKEISKFTQLMSERDEASNSAREKAVGAVREECRAKLQRLEEKTEERVQQAREARRLAVNELEETRKKLEAREEGEHEESETVDALQTALDEAQLHNRNLVEDFHGKEAKLSTLTGVFESIWKWAASKVEAHGLPLDVGKVWEDSGADGDEGKRWTFLLDTLFAELGRHRASFRQAAPEEGIAAPQASATAKSDTQAMSSVSGPLPPGLMTQEPAKSEEYGGGQDPQQAYDPRTRSDPALRLRAGSRRATVKSPHPGVLTPVPPSVEQEKSRRRGNMQQPKPIIKQRVTRSTPHANEFLLGQDWDAASLSPGSSKNSKRPRKTDEPQSVEPLSLSAPREQDHDSIEDDDYVPRAKRARTQKPKTQASSRRGRGTSSAQTKQPTPRSGLAGPGVVHGRLPPEVVQGRHAPPPEPKHMS